MAAATAGVDPMLPDLFRIRRVRPETHDTFTFELAPVQSGKRFSFLPGQFNIGIATHEGGMDDHSLNAVGFCPIKKRRT